MPARRARSNAGSTTCCSPTPSKRTRHTMADTTMLRPDVFRETVDASRFGVVEKPLAAWERIYNLAAVRKIAILLVLAAAWEIYARVLNNPLLFPTLSATLAAFWDALAQGTLLVKVWTSLRILLIGY